MDIIDERETLRKTLETLRQGQREETAEDVELRVLREDIRFEEAKARAAKDVRLGRVRLEPGQVIFKQMTNVQMREIEAGFKRGDDIGNIAAMNVLRACIVQPDLTTYDAWKVAYPFIDKAVSDAQADHNDAYRRERSGK